jgi:hypothetical protein
MNANQDVPRLASAANFSVTLAEKVLFVFVTTVVGPLIAGLGTSVVFGIKSLGVVYFWSIAPACLAAILLLRGMRANRERKMTAFVIQGAVRGVYAVAIYGAILSIFAATTSGELSVLVVGTYVTVFFGLQAIVAGAAMGAFLHALLRDARANRNTQTTAIVGDKS